MQEVDLFPSQSHDLPLRWLRTHSPWVRPETKRKRKNNPKLRIEWIYGEELGRGNPKVCMYTDPGEDAFLLESASDQCLQVHHFPRVIVHFSVSRSTNYHAKLLLTFLPSSFFRFCVVLWMCVRDCIYFIHFILSMTLGWSIYGPASLLPRWPKSPSLLD